MVLFSPGLRILFGDTLDPAVVLKPSGPMVPMSTTRAMEYGVGSPAGRLIVKENGPTGPDAISDVGIYQ